MNIIKKTFLSLFILFIYPITASAQGLVPCDGPDCGFGDLVQLASNLIDFMVLVSLPLAAIAFAWAGFLYLSSGGSQDKIKRAHGIFFKVAIGLIIVLGAYLIVNLIVEGLTGDAVEDYVSML
ncbi:MAG: hypothetical protein ACQEP6_01135 [Patescibacteria group bacterium]